MIDETILEAIDKMEKAVLHVQSQFATVRTGRAAPALVEQLQVEYYGAHVPLQQLASIQVPEARQLLIKPHDRASLPAVEKSIRESDLGVAPNNDGVVIRLNFPALTEERRRDYVKVAKNMAEDGRIAVRNIDVMHGSRSRQPRKTAIFLLMILIVQKKNLISTPTSTWSESTKDSAVKKLSSSRSREVMNNE